MWASAKGHLKTAEFLLAHKADIHAKDKVSPGKGCEGAPTDGGGCGVGEWGAARNPCTGCRRLGFGCCYGLMIMREGLGRGVKVMVVIRGCFALVYDMRSVEQADNPLT